MKTETSRRHIIAAGAAAIGATAVAAPVAPGAFAGDDPMLADFAEYERCRAVADAARKAAEQANKALSAALDVVGSVPFKGQQVYTLRRLDVLAEKPQRIMSKDELEDNIARLRKGWEMQQAEAEAATPDLEYEAARTALKANLPAYRKANINSRVARAEVTASQMENAVDEAQRALFETTPTSRAGAIALLRHAADYLDEIGVDDTLVCDVFTDAMRAAIAVLEMEALS